MLYIEPPSTDAAFHFAAEEYCMAQMDKWKEPVFMLWRTKPCVMLGRNQLLETEVNKQVTQEKGIQITRRSTGGGTIYTDMGTLLYTLITPCPVDEKGNSDFEAVKLSTLSKPVVDALNSIGVPAYQEGRNDILLDGRKISGLAQCISQNQICSHGSLLYNADLSTLLEVLRVDKAKIESKAISSVRARVTNIVDYLETPYTVEEFWAKFRDAFIEGQGFTQYNLTDVDLKEIESIRERKYANSKWTNDVPFSYNYTYEKRFPAGKLVVQLVVDKEKNIQDCKLCGDFMGMRPMELLENEIRGKAYKEAEIQQVLHGINLSPYLGNVLPEQLLECMFAQ